MRRVQDRQSHDDAGKLNWLIESPLGKAFLACPSNAVLEIDMLPGRDSPSRVYSHGIYLCVLKPYRGSNKLFNKLYNGGRTRCGRPLRLASSSIMQSLSIVETRTSVTSSTLVASTASTHHTIPKSFDLSLKRLRHLPRRLFFPPAATTDKIQMARSKRTLRLTPVYDIKVADIMG